MKKKIVGVCCAVFTAMGLASSVSAATISLGFDSLPSAQGWSYNGSSGPQESAVASVSGGVLTINSVGGGFGANQNPAGYTTTPIFNDNPFTLSVRARTLQEEVLQFGPAQTTTFQLRINDFIWNFALGTNLIGVANGTGTGTQFALDNTVFHDYVLSGTPGNSNYTVTVDGTSVFNGVREARAGGDIIFFGDGSSNANAYMEITKLEFSQSGTVVPIPAAVWLFSSGLLGLASIGRSRKR